VVILHLHWVIHQSSFPLYRPPAQQSSKKRSQRTKKEAPEGAYLKPQKKHAVGATSAGVVTYSTL
jgi:hypothetical protein